MKYRVFVDPGFVLMELRVNRRSPGLLLSPPVVT